MTVSIGKQRKEGGNTQLIARTCFRGLTTLCARKFCRQAGRAWSRPFAAQDILFRPLASSVCLSAPFGLTGGKRGRFFRLLEFGGLRHVIFFLRQDQDWETRLCAPLAWVAATVGAWQIPLKTRTIQTSRSEKGFARPAVLPDLS